MRRFGLGRFFGLMGCFAVLLLFCLMLWHHLPHAQATVAPNPIQLENQQPGSTNWRLTNPATQYEIEGYASLTSVNAGDAIRLYVNTQDPQYTLEVFRMGWYGGLGARQMTAAIDRPSLQQPDPFLDQKTGLIECDWQDPYVLDISPEWVSGVYLVKLTGSQTGKQSYIIFVVRADDRPSDYLFQSSVTTFQAYNNWGGKSLYQFNSHDRATKVSFNRPYAPSPNPAAAYGVGAGEFLVNYQPPERTSSAAWEYNMVRWLEREGYDVTYATDIDTHARPDLLKQHRVFLAVGHDEYWTWQMRQQVEAARDAGVSLAFFSANTCYWQIRLEPSVQQSQIDRTIVGYKERFALDPLKRDRVKENDRQVTSRWRQDPVSLPEAAMMGVMYQTDPVSGDMQIEPSVPNWVLARTGLKPGDKLVGLLGYEVDRITRASPANIIAIAHSPYPHRRSIRYADMTLYRANSGALVMATGTMQWSWGLDDFNAPQLRSSYLSPAAQQMTRNLLTRLKQRGRFVNGESD